MAIKARLHWFWRLLFLVLGLLVAQAILSIGLLFLVCDPVAFRLGKPIPFLHLVVGASLPAGGAVAWLIQRWSVQPMAVAVMCAGLLGIALFWPVRHLERQLTARARQWNCAINLGHLWKMMRAYPSPHHGQCPPTLAAFLDQYPDTRERGCVGRQNADFVSSYEYIPARRYNDYADADIIFNEKPGGRPWDGGNALFADGHFAWIEPYSRLLELVEQTKRRLAERAAASSQPSSGQVAR